jgi:ABC-type enterobactin transport system permease subunit
VLTAVTTGGDPVGVAGSLGMAIAMPLTFVVGVVLASVGGVWMVIQVIADSRAPDRYSRDVER